MLGHTDSESSYWIRMYFTVSLLWHIYLLYGKCLYSTCACSPQNVQVAKYVYTLISYKYYDLAIGLKPNAGIRDYLLRILVLGYWVLVMIIISHAHDSFVIMEYHKNKSGVLLVKFLVRNTNITILKMCLHHCITWKTVNYYKTCQKSVYYKWLVFESSHSIVNSREYWKPMIVSALLWTKTSLKLFVL